MRRCGRLSVALERTGLFIDENLKSFRINWPSWIIFSLNIVNVGEKAKIRLSLDDAFRMNSRAKWLLCEKISRNVSKNRFYMNVNLFSLVFPPEPNTQPG